MKLFYPHLQLSLFSLPSCVHCSCQIETIAIEYVCNMKMKMDPLMGGPKISAMLQLIDVSVENERGRERENERKREKVRL